MITFLIGAIVGCILTAMYHTDDEVSAEQEIEAAIDQIDQGHPYAAKLILIRSMHK